MIGPHRRPIVLAAALFMAGLFGGEAVAQSCAWSMRVQDEAGARAEPLSRSTTLRLGPGARVEPEPPGWAAHLIAAIEEDPRGAPGRLTMLPIGAIIPADSVADGAKLHLIAARAPLATIAQDYVQLAANQSFVEWIYAAGAGGGSRQFGDDVRAPRLGSSLPAEQCVVTLRR